ncbi:MAG: uroporphyrinogen decarboxylase family protein [Thermacetogeniaceae bacterium]
MAGYMDRIDELVAKIRDRVSKEPMTPAQRAAKVFTWDTSLDHAFGGFAFWDPRSVGITDISTKEFYTDPVKMCYCQIYAAERFEHDFPAVFADMYNIDVEACGTPLEYPEDSIPVIKEHPIKQKSDLAKLRIPDPQKDARMPYLLEVTNLFSQKVGDLFGCSVATNMPFSGVVGLRGYQNVIMDMRKDPLFVHEMLEYMLEVQIVFNKAIIDAGGAPVPCDAWAAPPNITPAQWEEFALPYATRLMEALKAHNGQKSNWFLGWGYSIVPDTERFLRMFNASGSGICFLFEEDIVGRAGYSTIDLEKFYEICRQQKVVLSTSLMPQTIFEGPVERIEKLVTDWHKVCGKGGGHCYYTTVPLGSPPEHVEAYVRALKNCLYPVE